LFARYVTDPATAIVTSPGLGEKIKWLAIHDFADVASYINRDPLSLGLKALESASLIYISAHGGKRSILT